VLVLALWLVLPAFPELVEPFPELAEEEVPALLPLLPQAVSAQPMARNRPVQSSQKT